ncbi:MAG: class I SAM-dependent methyltransferase [Anaerolineae bacterium]|nr:class I SAM-dependent methyltransferase [Anaerolineae bacterium]
MDSEYIERLLAINRRFYAELARPFSASRSLSDPAITCVLPYIPAGARVLDVGCGSGRLAMLLNRERPGVAYVGVDCVPELIEMARAQAHQLTAIVADFYVADVTRPGWYLSLPRAAFDRVLLLAMLHHLPGFATRARVLRESRDMLGPAGRLIISTWQFLDSPRMRRKIVDWSVEGIREEALEPGDYLLSWKRGGYGVRYCHLVDEAELERLAVESGLHICETFRVGGREGNLSLFAVMEKLDETSG